MRLTLILPAEKGRFLGGSEIANYVGRKAANITAWVYSTGKNKVKRTKPATYVAKEL